MGKAQEKLMQGVAYATQCLLVTNDEYRGISQALAILGSVLEADAIRIFQYYEENEATVRFEQRFEWSLDSLVCQVSNTLPDEAAGQAFFMPIEHNLFEQLCIGEMLFLPQDPTVAALKIWMEQQALHQLTLVPILIEDAFWGFVEIGCKDPQQSWSQEEQAAMQMVSAGIGGLLKRQRVQQALQQSRNELLAITASLGEGLFVIDRSACLSFINPEGERLLGYRRNELLGKNIHQFIHLHNQQGDQLALENCPIYQAMQSGAPYRCNDDVFLLKNGEFLPVSYVATPILEGGVTTGAVVVFRDMTEYKRSEQKLRMAAAVFENTAEGIMITNVQGMILTINPAFTEITGYSLETVLEQRADLLADSTESARQYEDIWATLSQTGQWQGEIEYKRPSGQAYVTALNISAVRDQTGRAIQYVWIFSDITDRKRYEEQIHYQAFHDALTGLLNRRAFEENLNQACLQKDRFALLLMDLDGFKEVNDLHGHKAGDWLLKEVALRINQCIPADGQAFRLGGDEFTILLRCGKGEFSLADGVVKQLAEALQAPYYVGENQVFVTSSMGISLFPEDAFLPKKLLERADIAMYRAKDRGKNCYVFYHHFGREAY